MFLIRLICLLSVLFLISVSSAEAQTQQQSPNFVIEEEEEERYLINEIENLNKVRQLRKDIQRLRKEIERAEQIIGILEKQHAVPETSEIVPSAPNELPDFEVNDLTQPDESAAQQTQQPSLSNNPCAEDPERCYERANRFTISQIRNSDKARSEYFGWLRGACEFDHVRSCLMLALQNQLPDQDMLPAFQKACDQDMYNGCLGVAEYHTKLGNTDQSAAVLKALCEKRTDQLISRLRPKAGSYSALGCLRYAQILDRSDNAGDALYYANLSCELGSEDGCELAQSLESFR